MSQRGAKTRHPGAVDEEERQYTTDGCTLEALDEKFPNRPKNHGRTLFFSELCQGLFEPLKAVKKQPSGPTRLRPRKGLSNTSPGERKYLIIQRFISKWRSEVGHDIFPALRLILPASDRERGMYKLKESAIARILVKVIKIDKNSDDGSSIINWKHPPSGESAATQAAAGDFAGRCFLVLSKRPVRVEPGDLRVADVNEMLDKLSAASGEREQRPIFEHFYQHMNSQELEWLIRIILKDMKVGAIEKTILGEWHHEALSLFGVCSSLRRVCWDLPDPKIRLSGSETSVTLMQCFRPQLAEYQMQVSFQKMIERLNASTRTPGNKKNKDGHASAQTGDDNNDLDEYWIEEKMDGERMQLHMCEDDSIPGGKRFRFWSRKVTDYTFLYGESLDTKEESALTRHLRTAFAPGVRNIILDGEMLARDPARNKYLKFGTLKTTALDAMKNPHDNDAPRPVFRVFDIVYLNDQPLTQYTLCDRRNALTKAVTGVPGRLELHEYEKARSPDAIAARLRKIVLDASEGLVIKNPLSKYAIDERNHTWIKVKPEYMIGYAKEVDVVIIGGYYGSGHRGGRLSSFMCGIRVARSDIEGGAHPEKCLSFIKVGGGFSTDDYDDIQQRTEGKWKVWDARKPPSRFIELAGGERHQYERPDVWIRPQDSVVLAVKATSIEESTSFATRFTLRFPRLKERRTDKSWDQTMDLDEFETFRVDTETEAKEKKFEMASGRRRPNKRIKREIVIAGQDAAPVAFAGPKTKVFEGLEFCILSDCTKPVKKTKTQLEVLVKENGGKISQRASPETGMILVAEKRVVKVASLLKAHETDIVRPKWVLDCIAQSDKKFLLPYELDHLFYATAATKAAAADNTDEFGDSYARDIGIQELRLLLKDMPTKVTFGERFVKQKFLDELNERGHDLGDLRGHLFRGLTIHLALTNHAAPLRLQKMRYWIKFGGGILLDDLGDDALTHIVVISDDQNGETGRAAQVRSVICARRLVPKVVSQAWIENCWKNRTLLDEDRFQL
ncbi:DNA ligase [Xylariaceae sp. FL0016]|nr:DNA ligase [Xylariaceae sp. FL0016]